MAEGLIDCGDESHPDDRAKEHYNVSGTATVPSGQIQGQYYLQNIPANNSSSPLWLTAQVSSSYGGAITRNAYLPQSPENFVYDADGNILTDGRWNYWWDGENRLVAMETYGNQPGNTTGVWNSGVPLQHIDFSYDYLGRRIDKAVSAWNGSAFSLASETRYVYDHWNLIGDFAVSGSTLTLAHTYLWGIDLSGNRHGAGGVGGLLAMVTASGSVELPVYDGNGNVMGLTDRNTGQLTACYEYSPFGELLRDTGTYAKVNPFRFSSKYTDDETGLVYYGHRYYNPLLAKFISRDPKEELGGLHLYAFLKNNAVGKWDYLGWESGMYLAGPATAFSPGAFASDSQNNALFSSGSSTAGLLSSINSGLDDGISDALNNTVNNEINDTINSAVVATSSLTNASPPSVTASSNAGSAIETSIAQIASGGTPTSVGNSNAAPNSSGTSSGNSLDSNGNMVDANGNPIQLPAVTVTATQPGYWDLYLQHIETYSITVSPALGAALIGGGVVPKSWVLRTGGAGPALGSTNPLTSVLRALSSNSFTNSALTRTGVAGVAVAGAAVGGYNTGVLLSGFVYAAFPGSNALPPPSPQSQSGP